MGLGLVSASLAAASAVVGCEGNCEDKLSCGPQVVSDGGSVAAGGSGGTGDGGTGGAGGMGPSYPPGAAIATAIIDRVRRDLPNFGTAQDTEGVCVLIRAEASDYAAERDGGWVIDFDLLIPFDPGWSNTPPPRAPAVA